MFLLSDRYIFEYEWRVLLKKNKKNSATQSYLYDYVHLYLYLWGPIMSAFFTASTMQPASVSELSHGCVSTT